MLENYLTIEKEVIFELTEKKSKFIARIIPVSSEEEAMQVLDKVRKIERDAKHNCFAYRIANGQERASDDGEPSGTAGVPMLELLRGSKLQNVIAIVTRYFGGILLGTGGLVRAYGDSTKGALNLANITEKRLKILYSVKIPYSFNDKVVYFCKNSGYELQKTTYEEIPNLSIAVKNEESDKFIKEITDITARTCQISVINEHFYA